MLNFNFSLTKIINKVIKHTATHQSGYFRSSKSSLASTFLTNTPYKAFATLSTPAQLVYSIRTKKPASLLKRRKFKLTTLSPISTTPLRGDQEPPTEDEVNDDDYPGLSIPPKSMFETKKKKKSS